MNGATPIVRAAQPSEAGTISALALRSKAHWGYSPAFMRKCRDELTYTGEDFAGQSFFVLQSEAGLIGFYALEQISPGQAELTALFVEPSHIGAGHGRRLIEHAKATAAARGFVELIVQGDPHAARFYAAAGGERIGDRESESVPGRLLPLFRIALDASL